MAEPLGRQRLADTKEGRLTIIVVVGGTLLVALSFMDVWMANTADDQADRIRSVLRRELVHVSDATLREFPDNADELAERAQDALVDANVPGRVTRVARPDRDEVVVSVDAGLGWHRRCIEAELRGDATVLTESHSHPC